MRIYKIANSIQDEGIDENTRIVGKIKSISDAKKMLGNKNLPGSGYESLVDKGEVKLHFEPQNSYTNPMKYKSSEDGIPKPYRTYLENNSGTFRVWTWIGF